MVSKKIGFITGGIALALLGIPALALQTSVGEAGIDARRLHNPPYNLTGRKISIGAVDIGRPRQFGIDKSVNRHREIPVTRVFFQDKSPNDQADAINEPNKQQAEQHAEQVASVMISSDKRLRGVAPDANLYATAVGMLQRSAQPEECLAAQHLALQNSGDVRAINFSFGETLQEDPRPNARLDGKALLTLCVDWSSRVHDVLYVIAGNQGMGGIPIPTDNYNGVNVAFTTLYNGVFSKIDLANLGTNFTGVFSRLTGFESNVDNRRLITLAAPGSNLEIMTMDGQVTQTSGTSFAAPHVTATVALLQEYSDRQLRQLLVQENIPNWTLDARNPQVMKAVLVNSTDKIKDNGDGKTLGMTRTIFANSKQDWLSSPAYRDQKLPLDGEMGSGQLNAYRAYQQFSAGQWQPDAPVPAIGWNYRTISEKSFDDYVLDQELVAGSYVSITLNWNRLVELNDGNNNGLYDLGETFSDKGLNNLDLYLLNADEDLSRLSEQDVARKAIWSSVSDVDSLEHIFYQIPKTGRYKIRVYYKQRVHENTQDYAIAWWTVPANSRRSE
ncbi:S8 family serine peptidase [Planktothricoides sp. FACHB-1370]|uniref:S8 family serine peptidase n=1 Tax=Planktothricoides raciborskii FACHB-1370 TaxID=2949576 RepID=A0ABR8E6Y3_9CYAN|nr:peptidase S8 and S53 subtilisin kexin sedolisin [Planktothricoides sp. SR001]MBD2542574.1 S8 family serine peptidase [Planktothricoides raciborskii FACHB-1370]MBD2581032.1 S8 family serine peptidase [Planktothricoides raciborskii FACHB-1261]